MEIKMEEIWKDIVGYEGKYRVSNLGNIKSLVGKTQTKHKKWFLDRNGYAIISLRKNGKGKWAFVHRLVAKAFIPNPENKPQVDHINTIRTDNRIDNLRWVTNFENSMNPISYKKSVRNINKQRINAIEKRKKPVRCVETGEVFSTRYEAVKKYGRNPKNSNSSILTAPLKNPERKAMGFHWEYI